MFSLALLYVPDKEIDGVAGVSAGSSYFQVTLSVGAVNPSADALLATPDICISASFHVMLSPVFALYT